MKVWIGGTRREMIWRVHAAGLIVRSNGPEYQLGMQPRAHPKSKIMLWCGINSKSPTQLLTWQIITNMIATSERNSITKVHQGDYMTGKKIEKVPQESPRRSEKSEEEWKAIRDSKDG